MSKLCGGQKKEDSLGFSNSIMECSWIHTNSFLLRVSSSSLKKLKLKKISKTSLSKTQPMSSFSQDLGPPSLAFLKSNLKKKKKKHKSIYLNGSYKNSQARR